MNEQAIRQIFEGYVDEKQCMKYHSKACLDAEDELESYMDQHIEASNVWNEMSVKVMCLAYEYEKDGFVAGFKMAMQLLSAILVREVA